MMADISMPSSLRPSDSWSCTEVKSLKHSHTWTVKGFSQCECRYLETSVKPLAQDSTFIFRLRLHPQGNKESNKDFTFFQVFCSRNETKYRAKFTVFNDRNEETTTTVYTGQQQLHGYFEYIRRDLLLNHLLPTDELNLMCELNIIFDTVTKSSYNRANNINTKELEVCSDLERLYQDSKMTDFMIVCGEREILVHRALLIARSPVFAAMLEHNTEEAQNNCVQLDDIDPEVLNEMLYYIYSGRSPNLREMATDLLAIADRFALPGLKEMADQVLRSSLAIDSVCRILVMADLHGAHCLKQDAVKYIAQNSAQVIQTEGWQRMITQQPQLVTEVVSAISSNNSEGHPPTPPHPFADISSAPALKRMRLSILSNAASSSSSTPAIGAISSKQF